MTNTSSIVIDQSLQDYFHAQVVASLAHQHVDVGQATQHYLSRLLAEFTDPRQLFSRTDHGWDMKPLAMHYADAVQAEGAQQRNLALKRLGDIALFIAGMFSGSFARKVVDVDYYAAMGGAAYRDLHDFVVARLGAAAQATPYAELGARFLTLVDVLAEVAEESHLGVRHDLLRDYELWMRTDSPRALSSLHRAGVLPSREALSMARH